MENLTYTTEEKKSDSGQKRPLLDTSDLSVEDAIFKMVEIYLKENPYLKIDSLANGDVSRSTIYNFLKQYPDKKLKLGSILGFMRSFHGNLSLSEVSRIYDGKLGEFLKKSVSFYRSHSNDKYASKDFEELLKQSDKFLIPLLASFKKGVAIDDLKKGFGMPFVNRLQEYVKQGLLVKKNGRIFLRNKIDDVALSSETTYKLAVNLASNCFKQHNFGSEDKSNTLFALLSWVDPDSKAIKEDAQAITKKYIEDMTRVYKSAPGNQPRWLVLLEDWLLEFLLQQPEKNGDNGNNGGVQ